MNRVMCEQKRQSEEKMGSLAMEEHGRGEATLGDEETVHEVKPIRCKKRHRGATAMVVRIVEGCC